MSKVPDIEIRPELPVILDSVPPPWNPFVSYQISHSYTGQSSGIEETYHPAYVVLRIVLVSNEDGVFPFVMYVTGSVLSSEMYLSTVDPDGLHCVSDKVSGPQSAVTLTVSTCKLLLD